MTDDPLAKFKSDCGLAAGEWLEAEVAERERLEELLDTICYLLFPCLGTVAGTRSADGRQSSDRRRPFVIPSRWWPHQPDPHM